MQALRIKAHHLNESAREFRSLLLLRPWLVVHGGAKLCLSTVVKLVTDQFEKRF